MQKQKKKKKTGQGWSSGHSPCLACMGAWLQPSTLWEKNTLDFPMNNGNWLDSRKWGGGKNTMPSWGQVSLHPQSWNSCSCLTTLLVECFYQEGILNFVRCLFCLIEVILWISPLHSVILVHYIDRCLHVEPSLHKFYLVMV